MKWYVMILRVVKMDEKLISIKEGFARRDLLFSAFFGGHRFILRPAPTLLARLKFAGRGASPLNDERKSCRKGFLFELPA